MPTARPIGRNKPLALFRNNYASAAGTTIDSTYLMGNEASPSSTWGSFSPATISVDNEGALIGPTTGDQNISSAYPGVAPSAGHIAGSARLRVSSTAGTNFEAQFFFEGASIEATIQFRYMPSATPGLGSFRVRVYDEDANSEFLFTAVEPPNIVGGEFVTLEFFATETLAVFTLDGTSYPVALPEWWAAVYARAYTGVYWTVRFRSVDIYEMEAGYDQGDYYPLSNFAAPRNIPWYVISGTVTDQSLIPAGGRVVRLHSRATGEVLATTETARGTELLLNGAGTVGGTTVIDSSGNDYLTSFSSGVTVSATQSLFGGQSLYVNFGTIRYDDEGVWTFPTNKDFTVEFALYVTNTTSTRIVLRLGGGDNYAEIFRLSNYHSLRIANGGVLTTVISSVGFMGGNVWYRLALTRQGNTWRMFVNGTLVGTAVNATSLNTGSYFAFSPTSQMVAYLDELRVTKGAALYTEDYTPSATPLVSSPKGGYSFETDYGGGQVQVVALDDDAGSALNDLIARVVLE
jgi:hypothetical protein